MKNYISRKFVSNCAPTDCFYFRVLFDSNRQIYRSSMASNLVSLYVLDILTYVMDDDNKFPEKGRVGGIIRMKNPFKILHTKYIKQNRKKESLFFFF